MQTFERKLDLSSSDEALVRAARNFALIYAGAQLAIDSGVVPWVRHEVLGAVIS